MAFRFRWSVGQKKRLQLPKRFRARVSHGITFFGSSGTYVLNTYKQNKLTVVIRSSLSNFHSRPPPGKGPVLMSKHPSMRIPANMWWRTLSIVDPSLSPNKKKHFEVHTVDPISETKSSHIVGYIYTRVCLSQYICIKRFVCVCVCLCLFN